MQSHRTCRALLAALLAIFSALNFSARADDALAWPPITAQTKPWAWWWWHGSAVDATNIAHELQRFHDAGLGGVQITSIYGTKGAEARDIPYLSPTWLTMMGCTVDDAKQLGMGVTMTLGSGWCFGGPTVSDQDANASVVVKTYSVVAGQKVNGKFNRDATQALVAFSPDGKSVELTDKISASGELDWIVPNDSTNWTIYAISQKASGQKVKRPAPGGEGWMLNPAYPLAMTNWLTWFDKALANYSGSKPEAVFQDSYEYRTDWSPDFFAQFEKRRGYKLQTELPALFGDAADDHAARVKYDYRLTLSDIMVQQSEPAWIDWAHKNGFSAIYQAHGTPGNWLDLYGDADMPETEMFHNDRSILISKFASSAAHTQGRPLTGAETGTWLKEHFTETLADVKYIADDMFLAGVNRIFYHGTCYSPDDAAWPGWLFYASTEMNPRNSIWHDVSAVNAYIARCQSILQFGQPDNDILLYWPVADFWSQPEGMLQPMAVGKTEWFENQPIGKTAHELWNKGYQFDYVSDEQLKTAKAVNGYIRLPGGKYRIIYVPECKYIDLETFKQLLSLAEKGATVVFVNDLPKGISGAKDIEKKQKEFAQLKSKIVFQKTFEGGFGMRTGDFLRTGKYGNGEIRCTDYFDTTCFAGSGLSYVKRAYFGEWKGWNYFIVNRGKAEFDNTVCLDGDYGESAVILDPMTGKSGLVKRETTGFHLQLAAGESVILRTFRTPSSSDVEPFRPKGPAWTYWQTNYQPAAISGDWKIKFLEGGPTLPADFQTAKLASWTTFPDTNTQAFAGTAKYETTFDAPDSAGTHFEINLGDVRQSARVRVNGKDYGTLITPPFRVVVDNLKPTGNTLEVEVTSVAANRIRDLDRRGVNWKIFKDINIVNVNYKPFNAADWPLTDCGLLGPVTLTPVTAK